MKKRLRKKRHLKEFAEYLVPIAAELCDDIDTSKFCDDCGDEAERLGTFCGGIFDDKKAQFHLEIGTLDQVTPTLPKFISWLRTNKMVKLFEVGCQFDMFHATTEDENALIAFYNEFFSRTKEK